MRLHKLLAQEGDWDVVDHGEVAKDEVVEQFPGKATQPLRVGGPGIACDQDSGFLVVPVRRVDDGANRQIRE